jgi:hypothetical protein
VVAQYKGYLQAIAAHMAALEQQQRPALDAAPAQSGIVHVMIELGSFLERVGCAGGAPLCYADHPAALIRLQAPRAGQSRGLRPEGALGLGLRAEARPALPPAQVGMHCPINLKKLFSHDLETLVQPQGEPWQPGWCSGAAAPGLQGAWRITGASAAR